MFIFKQPCTALRPTFYKLHATPLAHTLEKNYMFHPNMKTCHFQTRKCNKTAKTSKTSLKRHDMALLRSTNILVDDLRALFWPKSRST